MLTEHDLLRLHHLQLEHVNGTLVGSGWEDLPRTPTPPKRLRAHLPPASVGNLHADPDHCSLSWSHHDLTTRSVPRAMVMGWTPRSARAIQDEDVRPVPNVSRVQLGFDLDDDARRHRESASRPKSLDSPSERGACTTSGPCGRPRCFVQSQRERHSQRLGVWRLGVWTIRMEQSPYSSKVALRAALRSASLAAGRSSQVVGVLTAERESSLAATSGDVIHQVRLPSTNGNGSRLHGDWSRPNRGSEVPGSYGLPEARRAEPRRFSSEPPGPIVARRISLLVF